MGRLLAVRRPLAARFAGDAITVALRSGLRYRQVLMMGKHGDPKTVMRYDHVRENPDQDAVDFLGYDDE